MNFSFKRVYFATSNSQQSYCMHFIHPGSHPTELFSSFFGAFSMQISLHINSTSWWLAFLFGFGTKTSQELQDRRPQVHFLLDYMRQDDGPTFLCSSSYCKTHSATLTDRSTLPSSLYVTPLSRSQFWVAAKSRQESTSAFPSTIFSHLAFIFSTQH